MSSGTRQRHACFLSTDGLEDFVCDDHLALPALARAGWTVDTISWRDRGVRWNDYALVIVRSPWDYQRDPERFLDVLETIDDSGAMLANPLAPMKWNLDKAYLLELASRGVDTVPTRQGIGIDEKRLRHIAEAIGTSEFVLKPAVGANADHTYRLRWPPPPECLSQVLDSHGDGRWLAQPFLSSIVEEGEFSLFFFSGEFSHCILKTPKRGDFRVQEEHGGLIRAVSPDRALVSAGETVMSALPSGLLYARVDLARDERGRYLLMEVELIEPSLYFRMDPGAPERFASAVDRWIASAGALASDNALQP